MHSNHLVLTAITELVEEDTHFIDTFQIYGYIRFTNIPDERTQDTTK